VDSTFIVFLFLTYVNNYQENVNKNKRGNLSQKVPKSFKLFKKF
jgi:hypothetical protein